MLEKLRHNALVHASQLIEVPALAVPVSLLRDSLLAGLVVGDLLSAAGHAVFSELREDVDGLVFVIIVVIFFHLSDVGGRVGGGGGGGGLGRGLGVAIQRGLVYAGDLWRLNN